MENKFQLLMQKVKVGEGKTLIPVSSFFNEENPSGYSSKGELANHVEDLTKSRNLAWQINHLSTLFKIMKAGVPLSQAPQHTFEDGVKGTWLRARIGNVNQKLRILHFANIEKMIDDYANGAVKLNYTLEELYNQAKV